MEGFPIVEFLLVLLVGVMFLWIATLEWRLYRFTRILRMVFAGRAGADLEQVLRDFMQRMDTTEQKMTGLDTRVGQDLSAMSARISGLEQKAPLNVQHIGVIRFNPYADKGGDQSFAIALLDDRGDGVVLNGLHSRDTTRIYAKPIVG